MPLGPTPRGRRPYAIALVAARAVLNSREFLELLAYLMELSIILRILKRLREADEALLEFKVNHYLQKPNLRTIVLLASSYLN